MQLDNKKNGCAPRKQAPDSLEPLDKGKMGSDHWRLKINGHMDMLNPICKRGSKFNPALSKILMNFEQYICCLCTTAPDCYNILTNTTGICCEEVGIAIGTVHSCLTEGFV